MWLQKHFELTWSLDSAWVKQVASVSAHHIEKQVAPLRLSMWAVLTLLASSNNIVVKGIALFWLLVLGAVMRPAHLQRSQLIKVWPMSLEGRATADKTRTQGKRRAFSWRAPRFSVLGSDIAIAAWDFYVQSGSETRNYFLPDTSPRGAGLSAKSWQLTPMGQGKIRSLTNIILEAIGVPNINRQQLGGLYSARRVLPTLAHRMKFSDGERLDVGGWSKSSLSMPQRYSEAKSDEQADLRTELVKMASHALCKLMVANPRPTAALELGWSYTEIWNCFPARGTTTNLCDMKDAVQWCSRMFPGIGSCSYDNVAATAPFAVDSDSEPLSDSSTESEASDNASDRPCELRWLLAKGSKGCLHKAHETDAFYTTCGRCLRFPEEGAGLQEALGTDRLWSPRCFGSLDAHQKDWWIQAHKCSDE
jgi:hypothetical protein